MKVNKDKLIDLALTIPAACILIIKKIDKQIRKS